MFDAYSLLVEAGGRRLFYTGDICGSGRKAEMFEATGVHSLLMEGTHVPHRRCEARADRARARVEEANARKLAMLRAALTGGALGLYDGIQRA